MWLHLRKKLLVLGLFAGLSGQVFAQEINQTNFFNRRSTTTVNPNCPNCQPGGTVISPSPTIEPSVPSTPSTTTPSVTPMPVQPMPQPGQPPAPAPAPVMDSTAFSTPASAGTGAGETFNPAMFGDQLANSRVRNGKGSFQRLSAGAFKISDGESPRPTDRIFFTYNYFSNVNSGVGNANYDVHREIIGFEKTILDGDGSIGIRIPFLQTSGSNGNLPGSHNSGIQSSNLGDISIFTKYAFINDRHTGNVVSAGLVVTLPTGTALYNDAGRGFETYMFQPYVGWIYNVNRDLFVQGFHSMIFANTADEAIAFNNSISVGYWAWRNCDADARLRGIVPTTEFHWNTPLNHRGGADTTDTLFTSYVGTVTAGLTFVLPGNSTLGIAAGLPVTGPQPNDFEGIVHFNWRF